MAQKTVRFDALLLDDPQLHGERSGETGGVPWIERPALLFEGGEQKGVNYTPARLDRLVASFVPPQGDKDWTVPAQLDHSDSARDSIGHLRSVWRKGMQLWGWVRFVGVEAVEKVRGGLWNRISIAVYLDAKDNPTGFKEVTVTPFPHVEAARLFSKGAVKMADDKNKKAAECEADEEYSHDDEECETPAPPKKRKAPKMAADPKPAAVATQDADNPAIAAMQAEIETLKAAMAKQAADAAQVAAFAAAKDKVTAFAVEGKTTPAMVDHEMALLRTFSADQHELYGKVKAAQPKLVDTTVYGAADHRKPGAAAEMSQDKASAETDRLIKQYGAGPGAKKE